MILSLTVRRSWNSGTLVIRYWPPRSRASQRQRSMLARISARRLAVACGRLGELGLERGVVGMRRQRARRACRRCRGWPAPRSSPGRSASGRDRDRPRTTACAPPSACARRASPRPARRSSGWRPGRAAAPGAGGDRRAQRGGLVVGRIEPFGVDRARSPRAGLRACATGHCMTAGIAAPAAASAPGPPGAEVTRPRRPRAPAAVRRSCARGRQRSATRQGRPAATCAARVVIVRTCPCPSVPSSGRLARATCVGFCPFQAPLSTRAADWRAESGQAWIARNGRSPKARR